MTLATDPVFTRITINHEPLDIHPSIRNQIYTVKKQTCIKNKTHVTLLSSIKEITTIHSPPTLFFPFILITYTFYTFYTKKQPNMAVFLPLNATRRKRNLGESGTCMSNPNLMVGLDETYTYSERLSNQNAVNKMATPGYKHRIPETVESVLTIIKQKLKERHAEGPAGFLKIFRDIDVDHGGTIDRDELRRFLDYYHLGTNEEVFEKVFVSLDPDQSGDIDMSEFLEHLLDRTDVTSDNAEQGLLHSRQQGGSREFESSSPKPKECKPITNMTAEEVLQLVRQKVENRSSIINGVTQTSFRFFKRGIGLNTSITKDHFFAVLKQFNILLSDTLEQEVWDIFDEDQDGELSFEEFIDHFIAK